MFVLSVHPQPNQAEGRVITESDNEWKVLNGKYHLISQNQDGNATENHYMKIEGSQVLANALPNDNKGKLWLLTLELELTLKGPFHLLLLTFKK